MSELVLPPDLREQLGIQPFGLMRVKACVLFNVSQFFNEFNRAVVDFIRHAQDVLGTDTRPRRVRRARFHVEINNRLEFAAQPVAHVRQE